MTDVYVEAGNKRVFACAFDWPGWCRSAKDEAGALAALASYASRYAPVAKRARQPFSPSADAKFRVVERIQGSANTDFGVPHEIPKKDRSPLTAADGKRLAALVRAAWAVFDDVASKAPQSLKKGPRGGGRDRDVIIDHVVGADGIYARKLGLQMPVPARTDRSAIKAFRAAVLEALASPSKGGPLVEKGWPQRYAARRIAWHALDHAWEIEDKSQPDTG